MFFYLPVTLSRATEMKITTVRFPARAVWIVLVRLMMLYAIGIEVTSSGSNHGMLQYVDSQKVMI
jgi:hypothetical protein